MATLNSEVYENIDAPLANGTSVSHKVFGTGIVEAYDAASKAYRVRFGDITRMLIPRVITVIPEK